MLTLLPLNIYPEVVLLNHILILFILFKETSILFSIMTTNYIPTNSVQSSLFCTPIPTLIFCLFDNDHSNRCELFNILDINSLTWFTNVFPYSVGTLLKLCSLIYLHLFMFAFVAYALGVISKKLLARPLLRSILTMFIFPMRFMISGLLFNSLAHFEFIFMYCVR